MVDSNRIVSFDILKGVGILLVILGHIEIPYMLKIVIYSFHMPLFFFVSGCFLSFNQLERVYLKKNQAITDSLGFFCLFAFRIFVRFET